MGYRLRQGGHRIFLDKTLQATHLKRWTLRSVIRTDIFCRAIPWTRLILESDHVLNDLNLKWGQRLSGGLVMLAYVLIPFARDRAEMARSFSGCPPGCSLSQSGPVRILFPQAGAPLCSGVYPSSPPLLSLQHAQLRLCMDGV